MATPTSCRRTREAIPREIPWPNGSSLHSPCTQNEERPLAHSDESAEDVRSQYRLRRQIYNSEWQLRISNRRIRLTKQVSRGEELLRHDSEFKEPRFDPDYYER